MITTRTAQGYTAHCSSLFSQDVTVQLLCRKGKQVEIAVWEGVRKERKWLQRERCTKDELRMRIECRVRNSFICILLYVTIRPQEDFAQPQEISLFSPLIYPTQPHGTNSTLHFNLCWDLNVKECCTHKHPRILFPSRCVLCCDTWSSWFLIPPTHCSTAIQ